MKKLYKVIHEVIWLLDSNDLKQSYLIDLLQSEALKIPEYKKIIKTEKFRNKTLNILHKINFMVNE